MRVHLKKLEFHQVVIQTSVIQKATGALIKDWWLFMVFRAQHFCLWKVNLQLNFTNIYKTLKCSISLCVSWNKYIFNGITELCKLFDSILFYWWCFQAYPNHHPKTAVPQLRSTVPPLGRNLRQPLSLTRAVYFLQRLQTIIKSVNGLTLTESMRMKAVRCLWETLWRWNLITTT